MPKVVCVVDDQPSLRRMLRFALQLRGLDVLEAESGQDALDKLAGRSVDMLIVDWQMPEMDGLELVRRLRDSGNITGLPIIMISCRDDLEARKEARSLGVMTWLKKPFRIAEMQLVVESALGLYSDPAKQYVDQLAAGRF